MAHYDKQDFEETHENMRLRRYERKYRGHKLAVAVGLNKLQRQGGRAFRSNRIRMTPHKG